MNTTILIVVSKPWPDEAAISVFVAGQSRYTLSLPEHDVGSELFSLLRQWRTEGPVTVTLDRRQSQR
jgi:hypothetical protein